MRVTAKGEYATQAVLHLSLQYPEVVTIHEIAQRHHIPLKYLEQILLELRRGGILESRRGVRGEISGLKQIWKDVQVAVEKILSATTSEEVRKRTLSGGARRAETAPLE